MKQEQTEYIEDGFFLVSRQIFDNVLFEDPHCLRLFIFLLGKAMHTPYKNVPRGSYIRSYRKLTEDLSYIEKKGKKTYPLSRIKRMIGKLKKRGRITIKETQLGTLFTICNYEKYQNPQNYRIAEHPKQQDTSITTRVSEGEVIDSGTVTEHSRNNNNNEIKKRLVSTDGDLEKIHFQFKRVVTENGIPCNFQTLFFRLEKFISDYGVERVKSAGDVAVRHWIQNKHQKGDFIQYFSKILKEDYAAYN